MTSTLIVSPEVNQATGEVVVRWCDPQGGQAPLLAGDHNDWTAQPGTPSPEDAHVIEWRFTLPLDARIEYCFMDANGSPIKDPNNPHVMHNGYGAMSELMMPEYPRHPALRRLRDGFKGTTIGCDKHHLHSNFLGYETTFFVDTQWAGDDHSTLLLFNDGLDYIEFAHAREILSWLHDEGKIGTVTAVFVSPPNRHLPDPPNRRTEYDLNPLYASFITRELVPFIEASYNTGGSSSNRCLIGDSYGGVCSLFTAFSHPDVLGLAYSQSGYVGLRNDALFEVALREGGNVRFCFDIGTFETKVGSGMLDPNELDFYDANMRLHQLLLDAGIPHLFNVEPQGHTWGFWRDGLLRNLPLLLSNP